MKRLWRFNGGVHLDGNKSLSTARPIQDIDLPPKVFLPLRQHIGAAAKPVVKVGDSVDKGQPIAASASFLSASVHASVSGQVVDIADHVMPHPSGIAEKCIVIESDGMDRWWPGCAPLKRLELLSVERVRERIRSAGIVGLGGAVFPSAAKLSPPRAVDILVINGVECEPYITCDDMLMRERAADVILGARLLQRVVAAERCVIAVEDNKPEAIEALQSACDGLVGEGAPEPSACEVVAVPTVFPAGGEKQLIKVLTGREVPVGGLPYEVGAICLNVATTTAVYDAVYQGHSLVSRVVTVTGADVEKPGNYRVPIGTPIQAVLDTAGAPSGEGFRLVMGGPMMGNPLHDASSMVVKGTNCILIQHQEPAASKQVMPCIRCGSCADVCPMRLLPQQLYWHSRGGNLDRLEDYDLPSCIECGCCAVVCPSHIPLVGYFRFAKSELRDREYKKRRANEARARNEARQQRLEALQKEREERRRQRSAKRGGNGKKSAAAEKAPETSSQGKVA